MILGFSIGLFVFTMLISIVAVARVKLLYARYSKMPASSGYTGAEAAAHILHAAGINDVSIECADETLADHYDPTHKRLILSRENYMGASTAALGIAAHECGHAIQHKLAYAPLHWRMAAVGAVTYANQVILWLPLIGAFTGLIHGQMAALIMAAAWGVIMLFNLVTLPVEFDASRRAKVILGKMNFITAGEEEKAVKKVLDAAALTYVAAFVTSLLYFAWHILRALSDRR